MWYVYILLRNQKIFYVGMTDDVKERLRKHKASQSLYTKRFFDIEFSYCERYPNKHEAAKREKQLKGWSHAKKNKLIKGELGINTCTEIVEELISK
ncbi:MAG: GIY-YIG nuclease family protein [bacterium]|nr:GIY-YIG nuclease family protein [bacterium]